MSTRELTPEQVEKLNACKTTEEVFEFVKAEGFELTEKELEQINGGYKRNWDSPLCPFCGGLNTGFTGHGAYCYDCNKEFTGIFG